MSKKISKNIPVIAAVNEVAWYAQERENLGALSVKARWDLKKNIHILEPIAQNFREFRTGLQQDLEAEFSTDERSFDKEIEVDGEMRPGRQVKDEYLEEYRAKQAEMNEKINELINDIEEVELYVIDMDAEIENMKDDADLSDAAMDMLSLFMDTEGDE